MHTVTAMPLPDPPPPHVVEEQRAMLERRRQQENAALVARLDFAVYGLDDSWTGRRWIGGHGGAPEIDRVTLAHGDAFDADAPLVRVETHRPRPTDGPSSTTIEYAMAARSAAQSFWHETGERSDALTQTFRASDPTAGWDPLHIAVDGTDHPFRALRSASHWTALGVVGSTMIGIEARHIDPEAIRLVSVDDLDPYLRDSGMPAS